MNSHMKEALLRKSFKNAAMLGVIALTLTGCWSSDGWDKEYLCKGQERLTTHLQGHPQFENYEKKYAAEIDFHVRVDAVLVKTHQAKIRTVSDKLLAFQTSSESASVNGTFDATAGSLVLQESRTLVMDGTPQSMRVAGNYTCVSL
jgi:hypothetical protein